MAVAVVQSMTNKEAADLLHSLFAAIRGTWPPSGAPAIMGDGGLANAREAYACAAPDEQRAAFYAFQRYSVKLADQGPAPIAVTFTLGEDTTILKIPGFDNGKRWNGWAAPLIEAEQVAVMARTLSDAPRTYLFDGDVLTVTDNADDPACAESFTVEAEAIVCADGVERLLYDVSLGLIWEIGADGEVES